MNTASELCEDVEFKKNVKEFETSIGRLGSIIKSCCESEIYSKLTVEEKVKYDLFLSYSLTSLFWVYLRTQGEDPATHIKSELDRVRTYMGRSKQIEDRKSMPRLNQEAAKRFVRSGLWDPKQSEAPSTSRKRKHHTFNEDQ